MNDIAADLLSAVNRAAPYLVVFDREKAATPCAPGKRSPIQLLGHLVDSAINNIRRFVCVQLKNDMVMDGYRHYFPVIALALRSCSQGVVGEITGGSWSSRRNRDRLIAEWRRKWPAHTEKRQP